MEERIPLPPRHELPATAADSAAAQAESPSLPPPEKTPSVDGAAAAAVSSGDESTDADGDFEFEFPLIGRPGSPALADDLFADGRIRPLLYPVFGRGTESSTGADQAAAAPPRTRGPLGRLFLEESRARSPSTSSSSSSSDDLEGAPPESYCVWTPRTAGSGSPAPSPRSPRKSGSTGSMPRWRRISDLVVGRSHSDGKEKFLFIPVTPPAPPPAKESDHRSDKRKTRPPRPNPYAGNDAPGAAAEINATAAAHRMSYGAGAATPRRTFLPYREELVGFFANVNGISRSHPHPY